MRHTLPALLTALLLGATTALAQDGAVDPLAANPLELPAGSVGFCEACEIQNCGCDAERGMCVDCGSIEDGQGLVDDLSREATLNACLRTEGAFSDDRCNF